jgi:hypothetical protein
MTSMDHFGSLWLSRSRSSSSSSSKKNYAYIKPYLKTLERYPYSEPGPAYQEPGFNSRILKKYDSILLYQQKYKEWSLYYHKNLPLNIDVISVMMAYL